MPVVTLICGLPCSGKSTLAAVLAQESGAMWLSADGWMTRLAADRSVQDALREPVESIILELTEELVGRGQDVILDFGFWFREERRGLMDRFANAGAEVRIRVCEAPLPELLRRLSVRNGLPGSHLQIREEELRRWHDLWEPVAADEAPGQ